MDNLHWDDELKLELVRLKSEINPQSLSLAGKAIGIGEIKPIKKSRPKIEATMKSDRRIKPTIANEPLRPTPMPSNIGARVASQINNAKPGLSKLFLAYGFDLAFVAITLVVAALAIDGLALFWGPKSWNLSQAIMALALDKVGRFQIALVFVLVFSIYLILFRSFLGGTLGKSLYLSR